MGKALAAAAVLLLVGGAPARAQDPGPTIEISGGRATVGSPSPGYESSRRDGFWALALGWRFAGGLGLEARTYALAADFATTAPAVPAARIGVDARLVELSGSARPRRLRLRGVQPFLSVGAAMARVTDWLEVGTAPRETVRGTRIGGVGAIGLDAEVIGGVTVTGRVSWRNFGAAGQGLALPARLVGPGWDAGLRLALW